MSRFPIVVTALTLLTGCYTVVEEGRVRRIGLGVTRVQEAPDPMAEFAGERGVYSVVDFGAAGDGVVDDTEAFQTAMNAAAEDGGGLVLVPSGNFFIASHLSVPAHVSLEGVWRGPNRGPHGKGTTLLAVEGQGDENGIPFITLHTNSNLRGLTIHYPEQVDMNPPHAYPWTVRGQGENCSVIDVLMTNPYQAVDFGTEPNARHYIRGLNAQALYRGIYVDQSEDIGRIEDVHFGPFWKDTQALRDFTQEQGIAFTFGRAKGEYVTNSFCTNYNIGFLFGDFGHGPGTVLVSQSQARDTPTAVRVEQAQAGGGISFINSQFMAGIEIDVDNEGPVKFTASAFLPVEDTQYHALVSGKGHVFFEGCHFVDWDLAGTGEACIQANSDGITITGSDFQAEGKTQVSIGPNVNSAIVTSNRLRGGTRIVNESEGDVQIGFNTPAPGANSELEVIQIRSFGKSGQN